jgi:hypothetical protein
MIENMDNLFYIGTGLMCLLSLTAIIIMIVNRVHGRDELHGFFKVKPAKKEKKDNVNNP